MKNLTKIYLETINFIEFPEYFYDNCIITKYPFIDPETNHYHFDIRFNDKNRNLYDVNTIKTIINKGINKFNSDSNYEKYHEITQENTVAFSLESKSKNLIKIKLEIIKIGIITDKSSRYQNKYKCILHTILNNDQISYNSDNIILVKEDASLANIYNIEDSFKNTIPLIVE